MSEEAIDVGVDTTEAVVEAAVADVADAIADQEQIPAASLPVDSSDDEAEAVPAVEQVVIEATKEAATFAEEEAAAAAAAAEETTAVDGELTVDVVALNKEIDELEKKYTAAMERLGEFESICESLFPDETNLPIVPSKLAEYVASATMRIADLEMQLAEAVLKNAATSPANGSSSSIKDAGKIKSPGSMALASEAAVMEMAERELKLMEELIKQQEEYIAKLESESTTAQLETTAENL